MHKQSKKLLEFNGRALLFLSIDGTVWVAIKPICDALGVNYNRQLQNLKDDEFLGAAYAVQHMQVPGDQARSMASLPEKYLYGWLFGIRSESAELKAYKWECYQVLYDHFHGPLTERIQTLHQKSEAELALEKAMADLLETPAYQSVMVAREKVKASGRQLRELDKSLKAGQLTIWE